METVRIKPEMLETRGIAIIAGSAACVVFAVFVLNISDVECFFVCDVVWERENFAVRALATLVAPRWRRCFFSSAFFSSLRPSLTALGTVSES